MPDEDQVSQISREVFLGSMLPEAHSQGLAWAKAQTAKRMHEIHVRAREAVYRQGDTAEDYFFIVSGEVQLLAEGKPTWTFGPRSVIGNLDVMIERPRSRSAIAMTDTTLLRLRGDDWLEVLEDNFELTRAILGTIARTIQSLRMRVGPSEGLAEGNRAPAGSFPHRPLNIIERILVLRGVGAVARAGIQTLVSLAEQCGEIRPAKGDLVFDRGTDGEFLYIVAHGNIELTREEPPMAALFGAGAIIGDFPAFHDLAPYAARATSNSVILRFHIDDFFDVMEEHFDLVRSLLMYLGLTNEALLNRLPSS